MKNTIIFLAVTAVMMTFLSGCGHEHMWKEATCTEAKVCKECGATEGEALGHDWVDAACDSPKTCSRCGVIEGEALGHAWEEATCESPKTCSRCGATDGEALGHDWKLATTEVPKTCKVCGKTEGNPLSIEIYDFSKYYTDGFKRGAFNSDLGLFVRHKSNEHNHKLVEILKADDGSVQFSQQVEYGEYSGCYSVGSNNDPFISVVLMGCYIDPVKQESHAIILGWDGEKIIDDVIPYNLFIDNNQWNYVYTSDDDVIAIIIGDECKPIRYYNLKTSEVFEPDQLNVEILGNQETHRFGENHNEPFDETVWSYCAYQPIIDGFLVKRTSDEKWGYVDKDFNEIVIYEDATAFCELGYALVSEDRGHYYIIDSDYNKIYELEGDYKSAGMCGGNLFSVCKSDDSYIEVVLK